jgi:hypothetical protein
MADLPHMSHRIRRFRPALNRNRVLALCGIALVGMSVAAPASAEAPITVAAGKRQLFVDRYLIAEMKDARQVLHHPERREIAIKPEKPWEKNGVSTMVVIQDDARYRAWYCADAGDFPKAGAVVQGFPRQAYTCYAESTDGINWAKPNLGIVEFRGSKENNIVWANAEYNGDRGSGMNWGPFRDDNPAADPRGKIQGERGKFRPSLRVCFPRRPALEDGGHESHSFGSSVRFA